MRKKVSKMLTRNQIFVKWLIILGVILWIGVSIYLAHRAKSEDDSDIKIKVER
jgi:hypothetical protein